MYMCGQSNMQSYITFMMALGNYKWDMGRQKEK